MTIFEALKIDYIWQRALPDKFEQTAGTSGDPDTLFDELKAGLADHAMSEEGREVCPIAWKALDEEHKTSCATTHHSELDEHSLQVTGLTPGHTRIPWYFVI